MTTDMSVPEIQLEDLLSVREFARRYCNIVKSEDALRWQLRDRDCNGMVQAHAVVQNGGRILVNPPGYARWLMNRQAA